MPAPSGPQNPQSGNPPPQNAPSTSAPTATTSAATSSTAAGGSAFAEEPVPGPSRPTTGGTTEGTSQNMEDNRRSVPSPSDELSEIRQRRLQKFERAAGAPPENN